MKQILFLLFAMSLASLAQPQSPTKPAPAPSATSQVTPLSPGKSADPQVELESVKAQLKEMQGQILFLQDQILKRDQNIADLLNENVKLRSTKLEAAIEAYKASFNKPQVATTEPTKPKEQPKGQ